MATSPYTIDYAEGVSEDLANLRAHERKNVLDAIEKQLLHEPKRIILTRNGKPVALVIGVEGMDEEQLQLGSSDKFWRLIAERRAQKTMTRAQLEQSIKSAG